MDANTQAEKILKAFHFDFATFTLPGFMQAIGQSRGRKIIPVPWDMPLGLFGAWMSDGDEPQEYIFYRNDVPEMHQIHIQLHELSHLLFGHPTNKVTREWIAAAAAGETDLPFDDPTQLRSGNKKQREQEAETLANLIQESVILHAQIDRLIHAADPQEKLTDFLERMSAK